MLGALKVIGGVFENIRVCLLMLESLANRQGLNLLEKTQNYL